MKEWVSAGVWEVGVGECGSEGVKEWVSAGVSGSGRF